MNALKPLVTLLRSIDWRYTEKMAEIGDFFGGGMQTASGVTVTPDTAMRAQTVYACTRILSEDVAVLPGILYETTKEGFREKDKKNRLYSLLHDMPNETMTAVEFWTHMMWHKLLRGCGMARIIEGGDGVAAELRIMNPDRVRTLQPRNSGELPAYEFYDEWDNKLLLRYDEVFKVHGPFGMSVLSYMRETIGLQIAQNKYSSRFYGSFGAPQGVVTFKGSLGEDQTAINRWKENFTNTYSGVDNSWGVAVLENGAEFKPTTISPKDSDVIESEKLTANLICGGFRVPPWKTGLFDRATWGNVESANQDYLNSSLMIHLISINQAVYRDLFTADMREENTFEFLTAGILRGDLLARMSAYKIGREMGVLSANDIRKKENENPISKEDGGDTYLVPMNTMPASMLGKTLQPQKEQKAAPLDGSEQAASL